MGVAEVSTTGLHRCSLCGHPITEGEPDNQSANKHTVMVQDAAELVLHKLQVAVEYRNTDQVVTGEKLKYVSLEVVDASAVEAVELELVRQGKVKCTMSGGQKVSTSVERS